MPAPRRRRSRRTTTPVRRTAARGQGPRHERGHRSRASVSGAWWPRSDDLPAELPC
ncbi:DUF5994 family protein [Streptomyces chartreusis]|uniref:DUF5994 family protein n=1 Tax=Streptomyces chartreusis TaxID=1969 RepID=UPI00363FD457